MPSPHVLLQVVHNVQLITLNINEFREAKSRAVLTWSLALAALAAAHSQKMFEADDPRHSFGRTYAMSEDVVYA